MKGVLKWRLIKIDSNNQENNIEKALENAVSPNTSYKK